MTETSCTVFVIDPGKVERVAGRIVLPHDVSWDDAYAAARRLFGNVSYIAFSDDDGELARRDPGGEAAVDLYSRGLWPASQSPVKVYHPKAHAPKGAVEAVQWVDTPECRETMARWFEKNGDVFETDGQVAIIPDGPVVGDEIRLDVGTWVVLIDGEWCAMTNDTFTLCYEEHERSASSPWRTSPPTVEEVREYPWWWHRMPNGDFHVLHLEIKIGTDIIIDVEESAAHYCGGRFDPDAWPGEWAVCTPPYRAPTP